MSITLLVADGPFDWHVGRVVAGRLTGLRVVDLVDGIEDVPFVARLRRLAPELGGAFADIGRTDDVFVRLASLERRRPPSEGAVLRLQGTRDPAGRKPGRAALDWRFAGAHLVRLTGAAGPGVASMVGGAGSAKLRARAEALFAERPIQLQPAAADVDDAGLLAEAAWLDKIASAVQARSDTVRPPATLVDADTRLRLAIAAMAAGVERIVATERQRLRLRRLLAGLPLAVEPEGASDPWAAAGVEGALEAARGAEIGLPGGGALIVEATQALTAVDVDRRASKADVRAINRAATTALVEAIAVRELGGQIVVDFLDPGGKAEVAALKDQLARALAPLDARVLALLGGGLAVIERPRRRAALGERGDPPRAAADALLRRVAGRAKSTVRVAADVDDRLRRPGYAEAMRRWLATVGTTLDVVRDAGLPAATFVEDETIP